MTIAQIITDENGQSVRLPNDFRFDEDEVCAHRLGDILVLYSKDTAREKMIRSLSKFTPDYMAERDQPECEEDRDWSLDTCSKTFVGN